MSLGAGALAKNKKNTDASPSLQDKQKAEYLFLQALNYKSQDSLAAYFDLLSYAHRLDTTNSAIAYHYGMMLVIKDRSTDEEHDRGIELMKTFVDENPDSYFEAINFSDLCTSLNRKELALEVIKKQAELKPTDSEVQMRLAVAYIRNQKYAEALEAYNNIEKLEGKSVELSAYKSALSAQLNDTLSAIGYIRDLYNTAPSNVSYNLLMSDIFKKFQMSDSALLYLDKAQKLEPNNGYVLYSKAQYYDEIGDSINYDRQIYNALVSTDLDVPTKINVLAQYTSTQLMRNDSTERVNNLFKVLINQHPHEPQIHELYSMYFGSLKDYAKAAGELEYALDMEPTNLDYWLRLIRVNILGDNYSAAIKAAEKSLEYNPDNLDLYGFIAPSYYQIKEYDKALATYDKAMSLLDKTKDAEQYSNFLGGKADVIIEMGDTLAGYKLYDEALQLDPTNTSIMNNYAYNLSLNGRDLDKAESMAAKAVNANPDNATFIDTYAWVFFKKKNYDMALLYMKSAMANADSPSVDLLEHYGDILFMTGDTDAAVEQWKLALELDPDNELLMRKVQDKTYYEK